MCDENSICNSGMVLLLLSSACTESRPFLLLTPHHSELAGGQLGQLIQALHRGFPYLWHHAQHTKLQEDHSVRVVGLNQAGKPAR